MVASYGEACPARMAEAQVVGPSEGCVAMLSFTARRNVPGEGGESGSGARGGNCELHSEKNHSFRREGERERD